MLAAPNGQLLSDTPLPLAETAPVCGERRTFQALCKGEAEPEVKHVEEIIAAIDQAAASQCASVYIEILATPGHRKSKAFAFP